MRRMLLIVTVALVMAALVLAAAMPVFAGPKSANSCGASNPLFPAQTGEGLGSCGVSNNQNFPDKPEGQPFQD